jgi:eukaryotic-like serine/threonine-protein kinase
LETHRITQRLEPDPNRPHTTQLRSGTTLNERYLIQGVVGVGGMGAVYRARDMHFPNVVKLVAVKEMVNTSPDPLVRQTIVRNFEREANLLATLEHRAIPRIYDYFSINDRSYLILEFVNGKDLEALLVDTNGYISEERVITWALELCDVLAFLHNHKPEPIVFRDMKPSNVMINQQDHVVLVDFGIARTFQAGQKGTMIGTEGYSPPEQYRGEANNQADIYALGATLHHVLTRKDPRLEAPFSFSERPIQKYNSTVSKDLIEVVDVALRYNPSERYPNIDALREALLKVARKTGLLNDLSSPVTRMVSGAGIKPVWSFACEDEVRGAPTYHGGVLYIGSYDNNLYALNATSGEFLWKYAADGGVVSRPLVHDNQVYFGSEDRGLYAVAAHNGRINWSYFSEGPVRSSPSLAEGHIFVGSDDNRMHALNAVTGRAAWRADSGAPVRSTPLISNDFVYYGNENGELYCVDYSGVMKWRFNARRAITSSPRIANGVLYVGSVDNTLYALDARSGWALWRLRLNKPTISTPWIEENLLFTGAADGVIYCIDTNTTKEVWRFQTEHQVTGSPIIHKDSLYCGSVDGHLYCLEYRTGRLRWKFKTNGPITGTPAAANDIVYIGSTDHRVYALLA